MSYVAVTLDVPEALSEHASFLLHEEEASGVEIRDHEVLPPPGMKPPPDGRAVVVGFFGGDADGAAIGARVRDGVVALADGAEVRLGVATLPDEAWAETWKLHFKPVHAGGALWVLPPWEPPPPGAVAVVIVPGMAFGTGGHATTLRCLRGVVEARAAKPGATVLDVGCGSGVLAIAAKKLGAGRTVMIDNDPLAVQVAVENAGKNGCPSIEASATPVEEIPGTFDLVLANILANTLVELAAPIAARVAAGGTLLLSGILVPQADEVEAAYLARGLRSTGRQVEGEWALLALAR